jgi:hypothetical protein
VKSAVALCGLALLFALPAGASTEVYGPFTFSVRVKVKPEIVHGKVPRVLTTGSGSGSFFVQGHFMDRDEIVWNVHKVKGDLTLYQGGKLLAHLRLTGGVGYQPSGKTFRTVGLKGRLVGGGAFHCAHPKAYLTMDDVSPGPGNTDSFQFGACGSYADWRGAPAKVSIFITHR